MKVSAAYYSAETLHFLNVEDGLAGISVSKIIKDYNGRVWIAASNGINVFNGKRLITYDLSVCGKPHNQVSDICEGGDHTIYAVTRDGIIELKVGDGKFRPAFQSLQSPRCLFADGGKLYIGCRDGLYVYENRHIRRIPFGSGRTSLNNAIRMICKSNGYLYFFSRYAMHRLNLKTGKIKSIDVSTHLPVNASLGQFAVEGNSIYVGTKSDGLFRYDMRQHNIEQIASIGKVVTSVYNCNNGNICVGTDGSGAFKLDTRTNRVTAHFGTEEKGKHWLPTNAVYYYSTDGNGVDWLGLSRYGMAYSYFSANLFKVFAYNGFTTEGIDVRSFLIRGQECVIGTYNGFTFVDKRRKIVRTFPPTALGGAHIVTKIAYYHGLYYIGTSDGGLKVFDPASVSVRAQNLAPELDNSSISELKVSQDDRLWIGSSNGLYLVTGSKVQHFTEQNSRIVGGTINSIVFDNEGNAWITCKDGISMYVASSKVIENSNFPQGFFQGEKGLVGFNAHHKTIGFHNDYEAFYGTVTIVRGLNL